MFAKNVAADHFADYCWLQLYPNFLQAGFPFCRPTNSVEALKACKQLGVGFVGGDNLPGTLYVL